MTSPLWEPWNRRSRPGSDESDCQIGERSNQGSHCLWHNLNYCFHRVFLLREEGGCRWVGASDFIISWAACAYKNSIFVSRSSQQTLFWSFKKMFLHLYKRSCREGHPLPNETFPKNFVHSAINNYLSVFVPWKKGLSLQIEFREAHLSKLDQVHLACRTQLRTSWQWNLLNEKPIPIPDLRSTYQTYSQHTRNIVTISEVRSTYQKYGQNTRLKVTIPEILSKYQRALVAPPGGQIFY